MIVPPEDLNEIDSVEVNVMNTSFYIAISNEYNTNWKETILSFLQYMEREFSRFLSNNELSRLNEAKRDSIIVVSPILFDILKKAEEYRLKTEDRFSPYLLIRLEVHGYKQSFPFEVAQHEETIPRFKNEDKPLIFTEGYQVMKKTDQKVDLGGIAKGYAVEAISKWLQNHTRSTYGIVDGGGDMAMWSKGDKAWTIGIRDPFYEEIEIGSFSIRNGGVATSNTIYRSWLQGETKKHHILDGRTGMPTVSEVVQATVVTERCLDAEISAKLFFMDDVTTVKSVLSNINRKFSYVLVESNGKIEIGGSRENEH
ncbi:FAD:protein FMN transferase [Bacillus timonensis]|uniref:FAD:protein FMN transferase n=1 Tax=Bacillus timonensis TaxID=1033734 RepID=UPI001387277A|nr:FAD:protein FMN transferase [Bacillus timonensis]